jgi:hypothetical protein
LIFRLAIESRSQNPTLLIRQDDGLSHRGHVRPLLPRVGSGTH